MGIGWRVTVCRDPGSPDRFRQCAIVSPLPAAEGSGVTVDADDDRKLLRKLIEQGGRKYTAGNIDRRKYQRLVELGWLTAMSPNISDVLYEVTVKGRQDAS